MVSRCGPVRGRQWKRSSYNAERFLTRDLDGVLQRTINGGGVAWPSQPLGAMLATRDKHVSWSKCACIPKAGSMAPKTSHSACHTAVSRQVRECLPQELKQLLGSPPVELDGLADLVGDLTLFGPQSVQLQEPFPGVALDDSIKAPGRSVDRGALLLARLKRGNKRHRIVPQLAFNAKPVFFRTNCVENTYEQSLDNSRRDNRMCRVLAAGWRGQANAGRHSCRSGQACFLVGRHMPQSGKHGAQIRSLCMPRCRRFGHSSSRSSAIAA